MYKFVLYIQDFDIPKNYSATPVNLIVEAHCATKHNH
jgi:hypothetical protein